MVQSQLSQIKKYKIIENLGAGTYANSYLVSYENDQIAALKLMKAGIGDEGRKRFQNEEQALKKLSHPGIPKFIDSGEYEEMPFLVMSYAEGITLSKLAAEADKEGRHVGYVTALSIITQIFTILKYIHEKELNHRDIKPDNVIYNAATSKVTLIDFGFSKANFLPFKDLTFWNAGASRFSPPSKLESPSKDSPTHDVFAVGVLAYFLCTYKYPWNADIQGDAGTLKKLMLTQKPKPVNELNNIVPDELHQFIHNLLIVKDSSRPTTASALKKAMLIQKHIGESAKTSKKIKDNDLFSRVIRCSIHGDINFTEYEWSLINTREFNRLRYLKQLGTTHLVYPGATHSRFTHALGTVYCSTKIMDALEKVGGDSFSLKDKAIVRLYALMHDISHIPYGHTLEDELKIFKRHDRNLSRLERLLYASTSEIGEKLRSTEEGRIVLEMLNPEEDASHYLWAKEIVSSPIGADVLDYIDRDSVYCGLDHKVDSAIYRRFKIQQSYSSKKEHITASLYGKHGLRLDAEFAVNSILYQRFALFLKVYTHRVKIAAGAMMGKALSLELFYGDSDSPLQEERVEFMSDLQLELELIKSKRPGVSTLMKMLHERKIYKPVYRSRVIPEGTEWENAKFSGAEMEDLGLFDPETRLKIEERVAKKAKVKPYDVIIYCSPAAPGEKKFTQRVELEKGLAETRRHSYRWHIEMRKNHMSIWHIYGLVNPNLRDNKKHSIAEELQNIFGRRNEANLPERQLAIF